jgi:hypothetical protein
LIEAVSTQGSEPSWTDEQDALYSRWVNFFGEGAWSFLQKLMPGQDPRTHDPILIEPIPYNAWKKERAWTVADDNKLKALVAKYGTDDWKTIEREMLGWDAWQCKRRWERTLNPQICLEPWTKDEEKLLLALFPKYLGDRGIASWTKISTELEKITGRHRSDIQVRYKYLQLIRLQENAQYSKEQKKSLPPISDLGECKRFQTSEFYNFLNSIPG